MKCIDCKFCAFINNSTEEMIVTTQRIKSNWGSINGAYCMKTLCTMLDVTECSGYKKSEHKKAILLQ